jgi:hypothetical protein
MADGVGQLTTNSAKRFGCDADCARRAARPSRFCLPGWRRLHRTRCAAGSKRANESRPATHWNKQRRIAKIQRAYLIHRRCAAGHNGDCSAYGGGSRLVERTRPFCNRPPSPPGIASGGGHFMKAVTQLADQCLVANRRGSASIIEPLVRGRRSGSTHGDRKP